MGLRLLDVTNPLAISGVSISDDRKVIYITTNYDSNFDPNYASIQIDFEGGVLRTETGIVFQTTTGSFSLTDPAFTSSVYENFGKNITYGAEGMVFLCIAVVLLVIQLVITNRKAYHEMLSFVMLLQIIGLIRVK